MSFLTNLSQLQPKKLQQPLKQDFPSPGTCFPFGDRVRLLLAQSTSVSPPSLLHLGWVSRGGADSRLTQTHVLVLKTLLKSKEGALSVSLAKQRLIVAPEQQEGNCITASSHGFLVSEYSTACACGGKAEWNGLFSDLAEGI